MTDGITVTQVTASAEITVNTGNYESLKLSHFVNAELAPDVDPLSAMIELADLCKHAVALAASKVIERRDAQIQSIWRSLPAEARAKMLTKAGIDPSTEI